MNSDRWQLWGVHGVGADTPKGALVHRLVRAGVDHYRHAAWLASQGMGS